MRLKSTTKTSEVTLIYLNPLKQIKKLKFLAQSLSDTIINVKYFKKKNTPVHAGGSGTALVSSLATSS